MKGKILNMSNLKTVKTGKPVLSLSRKVGLFSFSSTAAQLMKIDKPGSEVEFFQSEDEPGDFYVCRTTSDEGFTLRLKTKSGTMLSFNSRSLGEVMLNEKREIKNVSWMISTVPVVIDEREWFYIIAGSAFNISK